MKLCSYSSKLMLDGYTVLDNRFLNEYLPSASGDDVKVYLYGLLLCSNPNVEENNIETIAKTLSLTETQIKDSFKYWQEMGLVQISSYDPFEVKYLPAKHLGGSLKIRDKGKYAEFNKQVEEIISGRAVTPNELNEYYTLIETYHFEPEAVVLIIKYCTILKNNAINYAYILSVARSFADEGLKTFEKVEAKFLEQEKSSTEIKMVLTALGIKRDSDIDERSCYIKWTTKFGFTHGLILEVAKSLKKHGGIKKLDELLCKYFELKLFTMADIANFEKEREALYDIAKAVSKNLGLYYQDYEIVVNTYAIDWHNKGYDKQTLEFLSEYCFKQSIRTLEGFNVTLQKMFKLGLITLPAIEQYIGGIIKLDSSVKEMLTAAGLVRNCTSFDRDCYKMWTEAWGFTHEQILLVAKHNADKASPVSYINRVLSGMHDEGITDTKQIEIKLKSKTENIKQNSNSNQSEIKSRDYTKEELNAVFDSLDDVEI